MIIMIENETSGPDLPPNLRIGVEQVLKMLLFMYEKGFFEMV